MSYLVDDSVSSIIPIFNRKKSKKMIEYNIINQDYPFIKELIIGYDSDIDKPIKFVFHIQLKIAKYQDAQLDRSVTFL